jgi:rRNA maturation protein Nop10
MGLKKIGVVAALVVVIVLAALLTATRVGCTGAPAGANPDPKLRSAAKVDMIDKNTFEIFTETAADWETQYAPDASGHYKNPKTGEYTMTSVIKCASCGALIPAPDFPAELRTTGRPGPDQLKAIEEQEEIRLNYKCPKCGQNAYPSEFDYFRMR